MAKPPGRCIFCGQGGLTKEHMWADWLRAYIPRVMKEHRTRSVLVFPDKFKESIERRTGDPHSRRIRCVCKKCNSGWMSRLQENTKPFLIPMLGGDQASFYKKGQKALAAWITMFVMVAEFTNRDRVSISDEERAWFMRTRRPPSHWHIWIGRYERSTGVGRWFHHVIPIVKHKVQIVTNGSVPRPNTQTSTILLGEHLIIHVMSSPIARGIIRKWRHPPDIASKLIQIWPIRNSVVRWPPPSIVGYVEVRRLADHFFDRIHAIARRRAGLE